MKRIEQDGEVTWDPETGESSLRAVSSEDPPWADGYPQMPCVLMLPEEDDRDDEVRWEAGYRAAATNMLREALKMLGFNGTEAAHAKWILEREATVGALRDVCADHGDNDWEPSLHLADVVEKHLARHLDSR